MKLDLNEYKVETNGALDMCAAVISDVHERNADSVIKNVRCISPDVIFIAGDLIEAKTPTKVSEKYGSDEAYRLIFELSWIAPVYYGLGNHESYLSDEKKKRASDSGAILLENEFLKVELGKNKFTVGAASPFTDENFIKRFASVDGYKILICHEPERYFKNFKVCGADLALAGHAHGGQWRFFGQGIYAPGQGIFPKYTKGFYGELLVSSGVSNHVSVPRINNRGEVISLKFV